MKGRHFYSFFNFQQRRFFFIISLTYKKSLAEVEKYLPDHRAYLDAYYKEEAFLASGPKIPRSGGIILSSLTSKPKLEEILAKDPFYIHDIANYEITEFHPTKCHKNFSASIDKFMPAEEVSKMIVG